MVRFQSIWYLVMKHWFLTVYYTVQFNADWIFSTKRCSIKQTNRNKQRWGNVWGLQTQDFVCDYSVSPVIMQKLDFKYCCSKCIGTAFADKSKSELCILLPILMTSFLKTYCHLVSRSHPPNFSQWLLSWSQNCLEYLIWTVFVVWSPVNQHITMCWAVYTWQ